MKRWFTNLALVLLLAGVAGCGTLGTDPRDPFEAWNRGAYEFNEGLDRDLLKPVSTAYKEVVPGPVRTWVRNFFSNLGDLWIGANNLLQGKPGETVIDWARFAFNTTFGLLGINDVATEMGLEKHDEDFGQTLGRWGMEDGNYHVWPLFGSRTSRDAYLQRRRSLIYDGSPPRAAREVPMAETEPSADARSSADAERRADAPPSASAPAPAAPAAAPQPAASEAAARLLEAPAAVAPTSGG
jgi:ABC-type transporter lipoprotein component MlaA